MPSFGETFIGAAGIVLALTGAAGANAPREQRLHLQQRLTEQKAALEAIHAKQTGALEALDFFQRRARSSSAQAQALGAKTALLEARWNAVREDEREAKLALDVQLERLGPRLNLLYRMRQHPPVELLLAASDFSSLLWRSEHLTAIVYRDLELLAEVKRMAAYHHLAASELGSLRSVIERWKEAARGEMDQAEQHQGEFRDLLTSLQGEERRSDRMIRELEAADRNLAKLVDGFGPGKAPSGFQTSKGRLPFPAKGIIEVGFGRVVNPRFNTVTVQKGVDIRAGQGSPVFAVADGKVAYSGWLRGYGNLIILDHGGGYYTLMAHLDSFSKSVGDAVKRGAELGKVGDTGSVKGPYLYFEIRKGKEALDPAAWLSESAR
jgi:septal ring factor EnvC (AmiA/AmiB activator)